MPAPSTRVLSLSPLRLVRGRKPADEFFFFENNNGHPARALLFGVEYVRRECATLNTGRMPVPPAVATLASMPLLAKADGFAPLDWAVLIAYFGLIAATGWWFSRKEVAGAREYFLAGRQMPMWAVAISVLATATSAATFIGAPQEAFESNLTYLSTNIGMFIAVGIVAVFFIPAFYRHNVTTVYDLLSVRLGSGARTAASWAFLGGRVFASGSRHYMAAIPLSLILFRDEAPEHLMLAIGVLTVAAILYTLSGGIRSIIWTDVIQTGVFVAAALAALVVVLGRIPVPIRELYQALLETRIGDGGAGGSKLAILNMGFDLSKPWLGLNLSEVNTLVTALLCFSLLGVASYGTDHDLAQRMLTCKSAVQGSRSVVVAILINLPVVTLFMLIGLLLYVLYRRPDLMGASAPAYSIDPKNKAFLEFILREMPAGMSGLMMAGLFAAGLGSCNSAINAMAAAFVNDCYKKVRPGLDDRAYLVAGRWAVVGWGVVLGGFACGCVYWQRGSGQSLIQFALSVMNFAYAGLLGVFFTAIFTRRGNSASAVAAILSGFIVVALMQPMVWKLWTPWVCEALVATKIAFPWHLFLGTIVATTVCCVGTRRASDGSEGLR